MLDGYVSVVSRHEFIGRRLEGSQHLLSFREPDIQRRALYYRPVEQPFCLVGSSQERVDGIASRRLPEKTDPAGVAGEEARSIVLNPFQRGNLVHQAEVGWDASP